MRHARRMCGTHARKRLTRVHCAHVAPKCSVRLSCDPKLGSALAPNGRRTAAATVALRILACRVLVAIFTPSCRHCVLVLCGKVSSQHGEYVLVYCYTYVVRIYVEGWEQSASV